MESLKNSKHAERTIPLQDFKVKLEDVWNAVKTESFVFNFKNSLSMKIYNEMQMLFDKKSNEIRILIAENVSDSSKEILNGQIEDVETALATLNSLIQQKEQTIIEKKDILMKELEELATANANSDFGMKSIPDFKIALERKIESSQNKDIDQVMSQFKGNKKKLENKSKLKEFKSMILNKTQEIVNEFLGKGDNVPVNVKKARFDELFRDWQNTAKKSDDELNKQLESEFESLKLQCQYLVYEKLRRQGCNPKEIATKIEADQIKSVDGFDWEKCHILGTPIKSHVKAKWTLTNPFATISGDDYDIANDKRRLLVLETYQKIKNALKKDENLLFENVLEGIVTSLKTPIGDGISYKSEFLLEFVAHFFNVVRKYLTTRCTNKFNMLSFQKYLKDNRKVLEKDFLDDCDKRENDSRFAELLFKKVVKGRVVEKQNDKLGVRVFEDLTRREIFLSKTDMLFVIHKELLGKNTSDVYEFCRNFRDYVVKWIKNNVREELKRNDYLHTTWTERTSNCLEEIEENIKSIPRDISSQEWLKSFLEKMQKTQVKSQKNIL